MLPKIYYDIAFSSRFLEKNAENSLFFKFFSSPEDFWEKKRSGNGKGKASPVAPYIFGIGDRSVVKGTENRRKGEKCH